MKIMFFEAYPGYAGAQKIVSSIAVEFEKKNIEVKYLLSDCINGDGYQVYKKKLKHVDCLTAPLILRKYGDEKSWFHPSKFIKTFIFGLIPYIYTMTRYMMKEKIDLVFCADIRGLVMIFIPALILNKKIIWHVHGKISINKKINRFLSKRITKIITPSKAVAKTIQSQTNLEVIYNGIDNPMKTLDYKKINNIKTIMNAHFKDIGLNKNRINLLSITTLYPQKGIHHLLEALNRIFKMDKSLKSKYTLTIIGSCQIKECKEYENYLHSFIALNDMEKNVFFAGWQTDVFSWLSNADVFIFPSVDKEVFLMNGKELSIQSSEGLPTVLIEATMLGVWSIATNVTGVDEILTEENGVIIEASSVTALEQAILNFDITKHIVTDYSERFQSHHMHNKFTQLLKNI